LILFEVKIPKISFEEFPFLLIPKIIDSDRKAKAIFSNEPLNPLSAIIFSYTNLPHYSSLVMFNFSSSSTSKTT